MSTLVFDQNGKHIMTNILTTGYLRQEIEAFYKISIPLEIKRVCFDFWFINICDQWDIDTCKYEGIECHGSIIEVNNLLDARSIYGTHSVSSGQYEWRLQHTSALEFAFFAVGIIQDDVLRQHLTRRFDIYRKGHGAFWFNYNGMFYKSSGPFKLTEQPRKDVKDLRISMQLDLDDKIIL